MIARLIAAAHLANSLCAPGMSSETTPPCVARQLSLSVDGKDAQFSGMQKSGTELSVRNRGSVCNLPASPRVEFPDSLEKALPIKRAVSIGMRPGLVMIPVRLAAGHRAATDLAWINGPVFAQNKLLRVAYLGVTIGYTNPRRHLADIIDMQPGNAANSNEPPLRAMEGMAVDGS